MEEKIPCDLPCEPPCEPACEAPADPATPAAPGRRKPVFHTEAAYVLGLLFTAIGVALMELADFGLSMVVAPAYVFYLKISETVPFFTFGMAEYTFQAVLLIVLFAIVGRFRKGWLFSFLTAVIYGFTLDGVMWLARFVPANGYLLRGLWYVLGMVICSAGIALMFRTYLSPEVYELFVKELALKLGKDIHRVKTVYDITSMVIAVILSFLFFGLWHFSGVKLGTLLCALINGFIISRFSKLYGHLFDFKDGLKWRAFFER